MLDLLDIASTMVFALTGALAASRKQMDVIGFVWLATITGVGGGTLRDLLLGAPVFWVYDQSFILTCTAVAVITHFTAHLIESRFRYLLWFDAVGMALVTIVGTSKAMQFGMPPMVCIAMGVITASFGGIVRDVLAQEPSVILRKEIYVTASVIGAVSFLGIIEAGYDQPVATAVGLVMAMGTRMLAIHYEWSMPTYRPRSGRSQAELRRLWGRGEK